MADEPVYTKPNSTVATEAWRKEDRDGPDESEARSFVVEGNDTRDFVGTDPIYENYATEAYKPVIAEDDSEASKLERDAVQRWDEINFPKSDDGEGSGSGDDQRSSGSGAERQGSDAPNGQQSGDASGESSERSPDGPTPPALP
jgi:hypothetical protein